MRCCTVRYQLVFEAASSILQVVCTGQIDLAPPQLRLAEEEPESKLLGSVSRQNNQSSCHACTS